MGAGSRKIMNNTEPPNRISRISLFRNWISLCGLVIAMGSFFSFVLLFAMDAASHSSNPYVGILTFVVAPTFLILGLFLMAVGWVLARRKVFKSAPSRVPHLLEIDLSRPRDRRGLVAFVLGAALFLLLSAIGSYRTYHFSESVQFCGQTCHEPMKPEFTTYQHSPHAKVECTACHVGPGVTSFVQAKLNGVRQLVGTLRNNFSRPIESPRNLRPAQVICEQCHWSKKYIGDLERTYTHFLSDETNTVTTVRMLLKVGGGDPTHGPVGGIHWHMNIANTVEYITTNGNRQVIPWVRLTDANGKVTEFKTDSFKDDPAKYQIRKVDCMDCHNRPAHQFRAPQDAVDLAMSLGRIDPTIPMIKSNLVDILTKTNTTEVLALKSIDSLLRTRYPAQARIDTVIKEAQQIYTNNFFPEMKADWRVYPDNIGHMNSAGCFRCHDGLHKSTDGKRKIEASDCNSCHVILAQGSGANLAQLNPVGIKFTHPDSSSDGDKANCIDCHAASQ
jgi:nitrate/TMAO reductase-like tetraheme cytochrome c subunit